jgi:hypothetical protein
VYRCELCERWFCEKHLKPRLAFIKDLEAIDKIPEIRALYYTEIEGKEGKGHPDFQYSRKRLEELDIEEKIRFELINKALNGENFSQCPKCGGWYNLYEEIIYCPKCGYQLDKISHADATPKPWMEKPFWHKRKPQARMEQTKEEITSEGPYHFERGESQDTKRRWRFPRIRLWYWFLLILFILGLVLFLLGNYYFSIVDSENPQSKEFGWELMLYSVFPLAILLAIGLLYFERWWKKHMRRFWNG